MGDYAKPGGFIILCYHFLVKLWRTNVCSRCSRQGFSPSGFAQRQSHLPRQREARGAQDRKKCGKDIGSGRGKTVALRCGVDGGRVAERSESSNPMIASGNHTDSNSGHPYGVRR